jgi:hypothetical protein
MAEESLHTLGHINHTTWTEGDFEVITVDGARFLVPSPYLCATR